MKKFIIAILTVFVSMVIMFLVIQNIPGNPVEMAANNIMQQQNVQYDVAYARAKSLLNYDPDLPIMQRFLIYIRGLATGSLGVSMAYNKPVRDLVSSALPWTFLVVSLSLLLSFVVGILLGIYIAWKRSKALDVIMVAYQSILGAIPNYVFGYLLIFLFSVTLGWLPNRGAYSTSVTVGWNWPFVQDVLQHAFLPVMTFFLTTVGEWVLAMKANSLGVLGEDYITYAQVRGLSNHRILIHYLTKNAILPMITTLAVSFGLMFGGSPLIENLFMYPGVGYYLNQALSRRDYPLMEGMFLIIIIMVVACSLIAEFLYKYLNPKLREK